MASSVRLPNPVRAMARAATVLLGVLGACSPSFAYEPQINYALQCMGCHTPDGSGVADRVPAIRETLPAFANLSEGRRFLVQVPGAAQSTLSNAELAELLNWMIETLSVPPPRAFVRYTEREVAGYRTLTLAQVRDVRERLLRQAVNTGHKPPAMAGAADAEARDKN